MTVALSVRVIAAPCMAIAGAPVILAIGDTGIPGRCPGNHRLKNSQLQSITIPNLGVPYYERTGSQLTSDTFKCNKVHFNLKFKSRVLAVHRFNYKLARNMCVRSYNTWRSMLQMLPVECTASRRIGWNSPHCFR